MEWATDNEVLYVLANKHGRPSQVLPTPPTAKLTPCPGYSAILLHPSEELVMADRLSCIPSKCVAA